MVERKHRKYHRTRVRRLFSISDVYQIRQRHLCASVLLNILEHDAQPLLLVGETYKTINETTRRFFFHFSKHMPVQRFDVFEWRLVSISFVPYL